VFRRLILSIEYIPSVSGQVTVVVKYVPVETVDPTYVCDVIVGTSKEMNSLDEGCFFLCYTHELLVE
jgi:hypothetical protein